MKYSGAELNLDAVDKHLGLVQEMDDPMSNKYNKFDLSLLEVNPVYFHKDLQGYIYDKARGVQWDASRKVLNRFC